MIWKRTIKATNPATAIKHHALPKKTTELRENKTILRYIGFRVSLKTPVVTINVAASGLRGLTVVWFILNSLMANTVITNPVTTSTVASNAFKEKSLAYNIRARSKREIKNILTRVNNKTAGGGIKFSSLYIMFSANPFNPVVDNHLGKKPKACRPHSHAPEPHQQ